MLLGTCRGRDSHTHPPTHLDWSSTQHILRTCSLSAGEVKFWRVYTARAKKGDSNLVQVPLPPGTCVQVYPGEAAGEAWYTHCSPLGWGVRGLINYGTLGEQPFRHVDRQMVPHDVRYTHCVTLTTATALMSVGDAFGRVMVVAYPRSQVSADLRLITVPSTEDRMLSEHVQSILRGVCDAVAMSPERIHVHRTGPSEIQITIGPPHSTTTTDGLRLSDMDARNIFGQTMLLHGGEEREEYHHSHGYGSGDDEDVLVLREGNNGGRDGGSSSSSSSRGVGIHGSSRGVGMRHSRRQGDVPYSSSSSGGGGDTRGGRSTSGRVRDHDDDDRDVQDQRSAMHIVSMLLQQCSDPVSPFRTHANLCGQIVDVQGVGVASGPRVHAGEMCVCVCVCAHIYTYIYAHT
jgi:hypothetical protein